MRRAPLGPLLVLALVGCGQRERTPALPAVRVELTAPADRAEVEARTVTVSGTVRPAVARVLVDGVQATPSAAGRFSAEVDLHGGGNVIDVQAAAPRRPAAMTVVRVTRLVPVPVPRLTGASVGEARGTLEGLGLEVEVREINPIDFVLPGSQGVCGTDPGEGAKVRVGATVTLLVQKSC